MWSLCRKYCEEEINRRKQAWSPGDTGRERGLKVTKGESGIGVCWCSGRGAAVSLELTGTLWRNLRETTWGPALLWKQQNKWLKLQVTAAGGVQLPCGSSETNSMFKFPYILVSITVMDCKNTHRHNLYCSVMVSNSQMIEDHHTNYVKQPGRAWGLIYKTNYLHVFQTFIALYELND